MRSLLFLLPLLACAGGEGTQPGDCSDGADNDADGLFDCNDEGCLGAPDCAEESDADTDADTDSDADADADSDSDSDADSDSDSDVDDTGLEDADGDGFPSDVDCDDQDSAVHPGAAEVCSNGTDDDCDGIALACPLSGDVDLGGAYASFVGTSANGSAGYGVALCDVNGDGQDDVAMGAYRATLGAASEGGAVYVFNGPIAPGQHLGSAANARFYGTQAGESIGYSMACAGDIDRDGYEDLLVGAPQNSLGGSQSGAVYLLFGPFSGDVAIGVGQVLELGPTTSYGLGSGTRPLGPIGDIDGNGSPDLALGAPNSSSQNAYGRVFLGVGPNPRAIDYMDSALVVAGTNSGDYAMTVGKSVTRAYDTNGDGHEDLLIGASGTSYASVGSSGAVFLFEGPILANLTTADADAMVYGETASGQVGTAVDASGDLDGDGYADFVVTAPVDGGGASGGGATYIISGPLTRYANAVSAASSGRLLGPTADEHVGSDVRILGDMDDDGNADFAVGAAASDVGGSNSGVVYVAFGPVVGNVDLGQAQATLPGEASTDEAGSRLDARGDADGDGWDDLLIGAPGAGTNEVGAVYLIRIAGAE